MKKILFCFIATMHVVCGYSQTITTRLASAYKIFENDSQLSNAISSLNVIDAKTGKVVFDKNSKIGLAPASSQKIITAATAYELLGKDFRFRTYFGRYSNYPVIVGTGDPTFGSWRYAATKDTVLFASILQGYTRVGIKGLNDILFLTGTALPNNGWIFEDIANYYGANAGEVNWHENQFDIVFIPGNKIGEKAELDTMLMPKRVWRNLDNKVKTGPVGSGDNAVVYPVPGSKGYLIKGTVPAGAKRFTIAASDYEDPRCSFVYEFSKYAASKGFEIGEDCLTKFNRQVGDSWMPFRFGDTAALSRVYFVHYSPWLDSISYWFLRKSINLYGEALINALAYQKGKEVTTENGISLLKDLWKSKGIQSTEINIVDGSGLSPLNRVTTSAQVKILQHAKKQSWFSGYYDAFPEYNGMKMKSGTIGGVKAFCGYHKSKAGREYIFSFIVNNYNGSSSALVQKMYKVLDVLK